ncbi:hypothetical protein Bxe_A4552 [Paraburkholderia xenovorans LB400]|uniref:Uncharacterized protein n=1 Tax=Paraburkholderia xenovorans (strain LB400) TaxID=266265 RepID=Q13XX5_PARXL|nr:hypothetical protein Bxe_A4552 [Paraburkholderia xenovorans LB400]
MDRADERKHRHTPRDASGSIPATNSIRCEAGFVDPGQAHENWRIGARDVRPFNARAGAKPGLMNRHLRRVEAAVAKPFRQLRTRAAPAPPLHWLHRRRVADSRFFAPSCH